MCRYYNKQNLPWKSVHIWMDFIQQNGLKRCSNVASLEWEEEKKSQNNMSNWNSPRLGSEKKRWVDLTTWRFCFILRFHSSCHTPGVPTELFHMTTLRKKTLTNLDCIIHWDTGLFITFMKVMQHQCGYWSNLSKVVHVKADRAERVTVWVNESQPEYRWDVEIKTEVWSVTTTQPLWSSSILPACTLLSLLSTSYYRYTWMENKAWISDNAMYCIWKHNQVCDTRYLSLMMNVNRAVVVFCPDPSFCFF